VPIPEWRYAVESGSRLLSGRRQEWAHCRHMHSCGADIPRQVLNAEAVVQHFEFDYPDLIR